MIDPLGTVPVASITGQVIDVVGDHGVWAVFVLMAIDSVFPAAGELVMLYAGVLAAGVIAGSPPTIFGFQPDAGLEAYLLMAAAGTLGYLLGSIVGWLIGSRGGRPLLERHGRWFHLSPERFDRAQRWFDRFGGYAVFIGRITPLARSFISIPAGVLESPFARYTLLSLAGSFIWCFAFAGAGWAFSGSWEHVHDAFHYVDIAVLLIAIAAIGLLIVRWRRRPAPDAS